jgi:hypothetical protein
MSENVSFEGGGLGHYIAERGAERGRHWTSLITEKWLMSDVFFIRSKFPSYPRHPRNPRFKFLIKAF